MKKYYMNSKELSWNDWYEYLYDCTKEFLIEVAELTTQETLDVCLYKTNQIEEMIENGDRFVVSNCLFEIKEEK